MIQSISAFKKPNQKKVKLKLIRTHLHLILEQKPMTLAHLEEFIKLYNPENRNKRTETWSDESEEGRWRKYSYDEILKRDKTSLDIFWLRDQSLTDLDNLPEPEILAQEIIENLESGLNSFKEIAETLEK